MAKQQQPAYHLGTSGEFVIENYNRAKPFASFFPGIAGPHGIPMWTFYVNRGQCLCSMGIEDKEHPIMEFLSANAAYQLAGTQGFRTFIKLCDGRGARVYEPFQDRASDHGQRRVQKMIIQPAQLTLEETNATLGLQFTVDFFNVPQDSYAGLVRVLTVRNTGRKAIRFEMLDGLALIVPFGVDNYNLKHMRRLAEAFVEVINYERGAPYFKCRVKQEDNPEITRIREGNFYVGFVPRGRGASLVMPAVDPQVVFGPLTDYSHPLAFAEQTPYRIGRQILENRLPCAMGLVSATLSPGRSYTYCSIIGSSRSVQELNQFLPRITRPDYIRRKQRENAELITRLTQPNFVRSSSRPFDLYCRQNFLDNTLRGGLPVSFHDDKKVTVVYLYSRKHGDLERDYNDYRLSPTNYSQGNGNFRDVNQNRRSDLLINPDVRESNVEHFYNLIQLDGYNPLVVKSTSFSAKGRKELGRVLAKAVPAKHRAEVNGFLASRRFAPGQLMAFLSDRGIRLSMPADEFVGKVLAACEKHQETDVGHGYWSDHWTYNIDLLENYLAVYPEKLRHILMDRKTFTFFDNPHRVLPRDDKYVIWDHHLMQLGAVVHDGEKEALVRARGADQHAVRTRMGRGDIYRTTLVNKLLSLALNKLASLDPFGVGVEMEADKPGWNDALNGLPGQFGSSTCEMLELKRLIQFLLDSFAALELGADESWPLYVEAEELMDRLQRLLKDYFSSKSARRDFEFWDKAGAAKEEYREKIRLGVSGNEERIRAGDLVDFLALALKKIDLGLARAWDRKRKILYTYFINQVVEHELITEVGPDGRKRVKKNARGQACFRVLRFTQVPLPLFLEGPVHYLRIERDTARASDLARRIRASALYDRKLRMYKVNEPLMDQPLEIGRLRTFSRSWLENETIWLHMEYKYLLELLRSGLHAEFFRDFKTALVPFLKPEVYGRSILENSSFIASSANPDPAVHGNGFVARLSGSTAEFIHILLHMAAGEKPFRVNGGGELELRLEPVLPAWLFTRAEATEPLWVNGRRTEVRLPANSFSFSFLGDIIVTYRNPRRRDTFGADAVQPQAWRITGLDGRVTTASGGSVTGALARAIRDRKVARIEVDLG